MNYLKYDREKIRGYSRHIELIYYRGSAVIPDFDNKKKRAEKHYSLSLAGAIIKFCIDIMEYGELPTIKTCELESCDNKFVDLSKHRNRVWCSPQCRYIKEKNEKEKNAEGGPSIDTKTKKPNKK